MSRRPTSPGAVAPMSRVAQSSYMIPEDTLLLKEWNIIAAQGQGPVVVVVVRGFIRSAFTIHSSSMEARGRKQSR